MGGKASFSYCKEKISKYQTYPEVDTSGGLVSSPLPGNLQVQADSLLISDIVESILVHLCMMA